MREKLNEPRSSGRAYGLPSHSWMMVPLNIQGRFTDCQRRFENGSVYLERWRALREDRPTRATFEETW